jgi:integrase
VVFKYAYDAALIDKPMRYGPTFKRPSKKMLRMARRAKGQRMFEAPGIRRMIGAAPAHLRAMILLGVNCGFGNHDVGTLPRNALHLDTGWVDFPRPKTAVERRCPLWPETVAALRVAIAKRPEPRDPGDGDLVFVTKYGKRWSTGSKANPISAECRKLLKKLGLHRPGLGFYSLRHTFATIAAGSRDQVAVDAIMGHADASIAAVYRERIDDDRLRVVTDQVRQWLFEIDNQAGGAPQSHEALATKPELKLYQEA